jgi:hypothetical protein
VLYGLALALLLPILPSLGFQADIDRTGFVPNLLPEYTFEIDGAEIFPNETIKRQITENYTESEYNTTRLEYDILGFHINASDARLHVDPSRIDDTKTRLDLQIYAEDVEVTGNADRYYDRVDLESLYGVYDENTDKVTMHVPLDVALSYIGELG